MPTVRRDTVYLHALESWRDGRLNLAHGIRNGKTKYKSRVAQKKRPEQLSVKAVLPKSLLVPDRCYLDMISAAVMLFNAINAFNTRKPH